jgi:hypothetical protein
MLLVLVRRNQAPRSAILVGPQIAEAIMTISLVNLQPLVALIAGILILLMPRLLNFIVAIYLIIVGIVGLTHSSL